MDKRYFDDIQLGEEYISDGRTITETDIVSFAGLSGDYNRLHINEEFMKNSSFGERIAHGLLILSIQSGLSSQIVKPDLAIKAFLGIDNWNFKKPVFINDTIHVRMKIVDKKETTKKNQGIIVWKRTVMNQHNIAVQEGDTSILLHRQNQVKGDNNL